jgi:hypothetical protein
MAQTLKNDFGEVIQGHDIFTSLNTLEQLRIFMEHHVFAVWDFMSLLKALQEKLAPHGCPWLPSRNPQAVRFINEIVLEEESDLARPGTPNEYASHFEIYLNSMREVNASTFAIEHFLDLVRLRGLDVALQAESVPLSAKQFMGSTFQTIQFGKVHEIASSFAYGRENLVPVMFLRILENSQITNTQAPLFYYYLERHAHLDGEQHGPMAENLLNSLVDGDATKLQEANLAAEKSVVSRMRFWDDVLREVSKG